MVSSTSEPQRANVVMHTPPSHTIHKSSSLGFSLHSDQSRLNTVLSNHIMHDAQRPNTTKSSPTTDSQRANVVMTTSQLQDPMRANSMKDEMNDILAGIPTQMISRTNHYTITNSMVSHLVY